MYSIWVLTFILLLSSNVFGYKTKGKTIIPNTKIINNKVVIDMTIEGGIEKDGVILNATVVYGKYPIDKTRNNKRYNNIVTFYENSDGGGATLTLTDASLGYVSLSNYNFANKISSIQLLDMNYVVNVYTGVEYLDTCWTFGSPIMVYNLQNYGINDKIQSVLLFNKNNNHGAATMYVNADFEGLSVYVPGGPGQSNLGYPNIAATSTISGACGTFPNNALSSVIVSPYTTFFYWTNDDFTGNALDYGGPENSYIYQSQVSYNDQASSVRVYNQSALY